MLTVYASYINNIISYIKFYLPLIVNIPELLSLPIIFSASQIYVPTSDNCMSIIVSELLITNPLTEVDILYSLVSDTFIRTPLKYQLIVGTGLPIA